MTYRGVHVLERKSQVVRGAGRVASRLPEEMKARGLTAKLLARQMEVWAARDPANRWALDYRTIQHAMHGTACALDTYLALAGFFGWGFIEDVQTPVVGADPVSALEAELEARLSQAAALHARVERGRAVRAAASAHLALVAGATPVPGSPQDGGSRSFDPATFGHLTDEPDGARP